MARRSYDQYCTLATALDVVGERWTLLIVRELLLGPRRFSDLVENLPGIGRNLLSARLKYLESEGLLERRKLPPPAGAQVYELSAEGARLAPAMAELARWGLGRIGQYREGQVFRPAWGMFPLSYGADREAARGVRDTYEFRIDEEIFHIQVNDGDVVPRAGPAERVDLVVTMSAATLLDLFSGVLAPDDGVAQGRITFEGEHDVLARAVRILAGSGARP